MTGKYVHEVMVLEISCCYMYMYTELGGVVGLKAAIWAEVRMARAPFAVESC